nr:MAG TPA: hypothetical protein [Caudoviricetes sp.]
MGFKTCFRRPFSCLSVSQKKTVTYYNIWYFICIICVN